jgi:hypothetical protein
VTSCPPLLLEPRAKKQRFAKNSAWRQTPRTAALNQAEARGIFPFRGGVYDYSALPAPCGARRLLPQTAAQGEDLFAASITKHLRGLSRSVLPSRHGLQIVKRRRLWLGNRFNIRFPLIPAICSLLWLCCLLCVYRMNSRPLGHNVHPVLRCQTWTRGVRPPEFVLGLESSQPGLKLTQVRPLPMSHSNVQVCGFFFRQR